MEPNYPWNYPSLVYGVSGLSGGTVTYAVTEDPRTPGEIALDNAWEKNRW